MKKILAPLFAMTTLFVGTAYAEELMDAREADATAVKTRQVTYQCQDNKTVKVTYGFNQQNLPTYAEAYLNGKTRFMPINLAHSDSVGTRFGDDNNFSLGASAFTLSNYHKTGIDTIQSPASDVLYKSCQVKLVKKLK